MLFPNTKLKTQLALINAFSKIVIIIIAALILPMVVAKISLREMDNQLINKLDQLYLIIEEMGIEEFVDIENNSLGYGSYNLLKEEYVSIEISADTVLTEFIESTQRIVDEEIIDYRIISATFEYDGYFYLLEIGKSTAAITLFENTLRKYTFVFLILLLALAVIFDLSITQILLRPFDQIIKKLKLIKHPSNFNYSKTNTTTSDFKYLEESIHHLMTRIEEVFNEEREYIGNISHEILTPISVIKSKLENFSANTNLSHEDAIKIYETKVTLGRLTKLVRSLLLLSRIENKEYLKDETIEINSVVRNVVNEIKEHLEAKNIKLMDDFCKETFLFSGNKELIHMMVYNLFNNAIKYTPEDGQIQVISTIENTGFKLMINDNGVGIAKDDIPYIFERFKKFQSGNNNFGLGLALVKKICDYHNIEISVNSIINTGTTFTLLLK